jgi:hypothetical protein
LFYDGNVVVVVVVGVVVDDSCSLKLLIVVIVGMKIREKNSQTFEFAEKGEGGRVRVNMTSTSAKNWLASLPSDH